MKTAPPAAPPAIARTWAWVRDVDGTGVGVGVGDEVRLAARSVVLDEDEVVVEDLAAEDDVVVVLLLLCNFEVELAAALELADATDANAAG